MSGFTKITIVLKDAPTHSDYNKRIIEYLMDRHSVINDNKHVIAIEVADNTNINQFVLDGVESVPAMKPSPGADAYVYGVNSILSALAKLEVPAPSTETAKESFHPGAEEEDNGMNAFYAMAMEEMISEEQEDPDQPSTAKGYKQDFSEKPISDKQIEEKLKAFSKPYEDRRRKSGNQRGPQKPSPAPTKAKRPGGIDVEKVIRDGGYDKGEELLMRQIAQSLN